MAAEHFMFRTVSQLPPAQRVAALQQALVSIRAQQESLAKEEHEAAELLKHAEQQVKTEHPEGHPK